MDRTPVTTGFWSGRLPHWEVEEGRYFVTLYLANAIPNAALAEIAEKSRVLRSHKPFDKQHALKVMRVIFRKLERWLDRVEPNHALSVPELAAVVQEAIEFRQTNGRWDVHEYVVMPSHLHLFLSMIRGTLKSAMEDFKRWTGHRATEFLALPNNRLWQDEWFDHWSRSDEQDERICAYIRQNPMKAGLVSHYTEWPYGSWNRPGKN